MVATPHRPPLDAACVTPGEPWRSVEALARVGSTNDVVRERSEPWQVVVAERQDAGRGRQGRAWSTTPGTSLAVSALVPAPASGPGWVPLLAGLAVHRAVAEVAGVETSLKWPNDVLVPGDGDRKLAGLLCEWTPAGVVVGLGLNVDATREELPLDTATSLRVAGAPGVDRATLLTSYLVHLARLVRDDTGPAGAGPTAYREVCGTVGREVEVRQPGDVVVSGVATGVDDAGRLSVRSGTRTCAVTAGDVLHVRAR
jgi:BirA family transcriptional regulator, biotin operon repressor / biotin---[acetyl-CoA-carboxylase] ligase